MSTRLCVVHCMWHTVTARPFLADFSCAPPCGGCISVNPGGMMSPPFTVRYNKVLLHHATFHSFAHT